MKRLSGSTSAPSKLLEKGQVGEQSAPLREQICIRHGFPEAVFARPDDSKFDRSRSGTTGLVRGEFLALAAGSRSRSAAAPALRPALFPRLAPTKRRLAPCDRVSPPGVWCISEFHGFLPFLRRICALIPIPVEPIAPRIREGSPQPSKAGVAPISVRGNARLETRAQEHSFRQRLSKACKLASLTSIYT